MALCSMIMFNKVWVVFMQPILNASSHKFLYQCISTKYIRKKNNKGILK